jgi:hypothetical protein
MAIRPDALPADPAALTEMVLALDAENEKLRVAMQTLKEMIFGKRSERPACPEWLQLHLRRSQYLSTYSDDFVMHVLDPSLQDRSEADSPANGEKTVTIYTPGKWKLQIELKLAVSSTGSLPKHFSPLSL